MTYEIPDDRHYLETHEWVLPADGTATVGISSFAQDELGDIVFVELPAEGDVLTQNETFGVIESIKAVSDLYAPISGTVTAVNDELETAPELVNDDPYGDGWMVKLDLSDEDEIADLLSAEDYRNQIE
ncbi:MAG: glycine cleavage system protein GcvH [Halobacteriales archaeon]|nr:glycine cleavage system protein GcvH [Halobacteriales archaeon]